MRVLRPKTRNWPQTRAVCAIAALLALPACGDDGSDGDGHTHTPDTCEAADTFAPNLAKTGESGVTVTIVQATPAVPMVNMDNTWSVRVTDASGAPLEGAVLEMKQTMPAHDGHGSSRVAVSADKGGGVYDLTPVHFPMGGVWDVPIKVMKGPVSETVGFEFCIDG